MTDTAEAQKKPEGQGDSNPEWKPPELSGELGMDIIGSMPYVSVAKIRERTKRQTERRLKKAKGDTPSKGQVDEVFKVLGQRGIGLSTLVRGDQQEAGAIGFYLAFKLLDKILVYFNHCYIFFCT